MEIQECSRIIKVLIDLLPVFSWKRDYVLFRDMSLRSTKDQYLFPADVQKCLLSGSQSVGSGPTASAPPANWLYMQIPEPLPVWWVRNEKRNQEPVFNDFFRLQCEKPGLL